MSRLAIGEEQLVQFCQEHHIRKSSLFGSTLKGTDRPVSDVDLLVKFETGCVLGLLALVSMEAELGKMLGGRKIDLRTPRDLSRHFRDEVIRTAEVQYAA